MKSIVRIGISVVILTALASGAVAQVRVVTYNTLDGPVNTTEDGYVETIFGAIANESLNGVATRASVIALQEQTSTTASRLAGVLSNLHSGSNYQAVDAYPGSVDRTAMVYDASVVQKIDNSLVYLGTRYAQRVQFRPVGYSSSEADFYVYSFHLKAGNDSSDASRRYSEAVNLRDDADALGQGAHVIYAGDYNVYSSYEQAYQHLLSSGNGQAWDPIETPGAWHAGMGYISTFTQSTRSGNLPDGGSSGGVDDRFDQLLTTYELKDGEGLSYIGPTTDDTTGATRSYMPLGNDGTCSAIYNNNINISQNDAQPQNVLDALYYFSDHLPVMMDIQVPAKMSASSTAPNDVIVGATAEAEVTVSNSANVVAAAGADELDYSVSASGDLSGSASGSDDALGGADTHNLTMDTSSAGAKSGQVNVTSTSQGVESGSYSDTIDYNVLDHSNASLRSDMDDNDRGLYFGTVREGRAADPIALPIFNLESTAGYTAALDIDGQTGTGDTSVLTTDVIATSDIAAGSLADFDAYLDTTTPGSYSAQYTVLVSDEDLPGGTSGTSLQLYLSAVVSLYGDVDTDGDATVDDIDADDIDTLYDRFGGDDMFADLDDSGLVDQADTDELVINVLGTNYGDNDLDMDIDATDLATLGMSWDPIATNLGWADGDNDGDGDVDATDLATLGMNWDPLGSNPIPEPTSLVLLGIGAMGLLRKRS